MYVHMLRRRATALSLASLTLLTLAACGSTKTTTVADSTNTTSAQPLTSATFPPTTVAFSVLKTASKDGVGTYLVDTAGKTLYMFDRDTSPTSACTGQCATTWPPLLLPPGAGTPLPAQAGVTGTLTVVARPDQAGSQVDLNGKPLYHYSGDSNAGDTNGDGVGGIWHIAKLS